MKSCRWSGSSFLYVASKREAWSAFRHLTVKHADVQSPFLLVIVWQYRTRHNLTNVSVWLMCQLKTKGKRLVSRCHEWVLLLWLSSIWLCWKGTQKVLLIAQAPPGLLEWKKNKQHTVEREGINIRKLGDKQELWDSRIYIYELKWSGSVSGLSQSFFYGYFRVCLQRANCCGCCGEYRCFRFEWQVVIYADLCSWSEPLHENRISYYSMLEYKQSHFKWNTYEWNSIHPVSKPLAHMYELKTCFKKGQTCFYTLF